MRYYSSSPYQRRWLREPDGILFGVCGGLARRLGISSFAVRLVTFLAFCATGFFPVRVTPTIALYLPHGKPFTPPEGFGISMLMYSSRDTGEHLFTVHEGYLSRSELDTLIKALRDA